MKAQDAESALVLLLELSPLELLLRVLPLLDLLELLLLELLLGVLLLELLLLEVLLGFCCCLWFCWLRPCSCHYSYCGLDRIFVIVPPHLASLCCYNLPHLAPCSLPRSHLSYSFFFYHPISCLASAYFRYCQAPSDLASYFLLLLFSSSASCFLLFLLPPSCSLPCFLFLLLHVIGQIHDKCCQGQYILMYYQEATIGALRCPK